jgi:RHH-type transcriptional regulator, rel operon repressor / antitoxin RelB
MLAIRLDKKIEERLATLARRTGRTKTYYAREAILAHLEELEDKHRAVERLSTPTRLYSAADGGIDLRAVKRSLHAVDSRSSFWLDQSHAERLAAVEAIRLTTPDSSYAQQAFPRFSRVTRKAQS